MSEINRSLEDKGNVGARRELRWGPTQDRVQKPNVVFCLPSQMGLQVSGCRELTSCN